LQHKVENLQAHIISFNLNGLLTALLEKDYAQALHIVQSASAMDETELELLCTVARQLEQALDQEKRLPLMLDVLSSKMLSVGRAVATVAAPVCMALSAGMFVSAYHTHKDYQRKIGLGLEAIEELKGIPTMAQRVINQRDSSEAAFTIVNDQTQIYMTTLPNRLAKALFSEDSLDKVSLERWAEIEVCTPPHLFPSRESQGSLEAWTFIIERKKQTAAEKNKGVREFEATVNLDSPAVGDRTKKAPKKPTEKRIQPVCLLGLYHHSYKDLFTRLAEQTNWHLPEGATEHITVLAKETALRLLEAGDACEKVFGPLRRHQVDTYARVAGGLVALLGAGVHASSAYLAHRLKKGASRREYWRSFIKAAQLCKRCKECHTVNEKSAA
jgi:hypothetical protein